MNIPSPDFFAWGVFCLAMGGGVLLLGWMLGLRDRDQRLSCEISRERTRAAIAEEMRRRAERHCLQLRDELHVANLRIRHLQESNQQMVLRAVLPPEVRRGG